MCQIYSNTDNIYSDLLVQDCLGLLCMRSHLFLYLYLIMIICRLCMRTLCLSFLHVSNLNFSVNLSLVLFRPLFNPFNESQTICCCAPGLFEGLHYIYCLVKLFFKSFNFCSSLNSLCLPTLYSICHHQLISYLNEIPLLFTVEKILCQNSLVITVTIFYNYQTTLTTFYNSSQFILLEKTNAASYSTHTHCFSHKFRIRSNNESLIRIVK